MAEIIEGYGKIDILVNNAGVLRDRSFLKMTQEEWDTVINVNLSALFTTTQAVLPHMREAVMVASYRPHRSTVLLGLLVKPITLQRKQESQGLPALAREVGRFGITANAIAPGFIESEMTASMPPEVVKAGIAMIPVGRIGTPEDMGMLICI